MKRERERVCVCMCVGSQRESGGGVDRQKDKGRLSERGSSWKMADSFLVQERKSLKRRTHCPLSFSSWS